MANSDKLDTVSVTKGSKWLVGWRAAKANFWPGLILQGLMLMILLAHYWHRPTQDFLEGLARNKKSLGYAYSALAGIVAGAVLPEFLRIFIFQNGKVNPRNWKQLRFTVPLWATLSVLVDCFYRLQAHWFGDEAIPSVVIPQVLVDQFVYSPFLAAPLSVWCYDWHNSNYKWPRAWWTWSYYKNRIAPTLLANWVVWIPVVSILYTLPETVQIPLFALALAFWVMLFTWMSEERSES